MSVARKFLIRYNAEVFGSVTFARRHVNRMSDRKVRAAVAQVREFAKLTDIHTRLGE